MSGQKQVFHHSQNKGKYRYVVQVFSDDLNEKNIPYPFPLKKMINDAVATHYDQILADVDRDDTLKKAAEQLTEFAADVAKDIQSQYD